MVSQDLINKAVLDQLDALKAAFADIPQARKATLDQLAALAGEALKEKQHIGLTFVCTHNSRRSQLAQVWLPVAAAHYGVSGLWSFSGGTESTAFNHRMVAALQRFGFELNTENPEAENPVYTMPGWEGSTLFSKKYDEAPNPVEDFFAIMVCDHADANCPFVPGAMKRISLPFTDPKEADDSPREEAAYDAKVREIGSAILYLVSRI